MAGPAWGSAGCHVAGCHWDKIIYNFLKLSLEKRRCSDIYSYVVRVDVGTSSLLCFFFNFFFIQCWIIRKKKKGCYNKHER